MTKKRYLILSPDYSPERKSELELKAATYYGEKDYERVSLDDPDLSELMRKIMGGLTESTVGLLVIGMAAIAMSKSDSIYVAKDWEKEDVCKVAHMLAFTHGLDIVYESK